MEHPLHSRARHSIEFLALGRALLYTEQTIESHAAVLDAALLPAVAQKRLQALARRTLGYTTVRPQPRLKALVRLLRGDGLFRQVLDRHSLQVALIPAPPRMLRLQGTGELPKLDTVRDLADWLRLDPEHLLWFGDLHDRNAAPKPSPLTHYHARVVVKADGSIRLLEIPKQRLKSLQRQILDGILAPIPLHPAVHGFRKGRSIVTYAAPHAARDVVLRLDLQNFFPSVSGPRVQALFRTLGYPEPVADLLGGVCTTTTPRRSWRHPGCEIGSEELQRVRVFYARPHLPQGAPTSPGVANLCAFRLDRRLAGLAETAGAVYTRYADDLAFSGGPEFGRSAGRFALRVAAIVSEEGFSVQHRKTRLMRASVRQHLAGLTLNQRPNLPRERFKLLEAILTNCVRHGPEAQNREEHPDFRSHLTGRVAFASMVNPERAARLKDLLAEVRWS